MKIKNKSNFLLLILIPTMTDTTKTVNIEPFDLNPELIILGSGTSEGVPRLSCLTGGVHCEVCHAARFSPDSIHRRRNTSAIIAFNTKKTKVRGRVHVISPNRSQSLNSQYLTTQ